MIRLRAFLQRADAYSCGSSAERDHVRRDVSHQRHPGDRDDVLTIWDTANLSPIAEVVLLSGKRFMGMLQRVALQTLNADKWLAIFNMSPLYVVSVDLDARELHWRDTNAGLQLYLPQRRSGSSAPSVPMVVCSR